MRSIRIALSLCVLTLLLFGIVYPAAMVGLGNLLAPRAAEGLPIYRDGVLVGFENVGQVFNSPAYFWSRPSAVNYDASATGGSNLGPTNPELLQLVQDRIDTLRTYHPGLRPQDIPVDLVTASGSGLDPHISKQAALLQVSRLAKTRNLSEEDLTQLVDRHTQSPFLGLLGPGDYVNVLRLNLALDELAQ